MKRDLDALSSREFDVVVVGGGIYGACIARDAALRGLSTALIEHSDFCSGTSHNSLKIIHSGIRYLQHLDFRRVRESINERRSWFSIAPHLVRPLKFVIPSQGYLTRGPFALQAALLMHRALGFDWNRGVPAESRIPIGRVHGRRALEAAIPGLPEGGLSGMASWYDGQVVDADRLVIECLQSAVDSGAVVANYLTAETLLTSGGRVRGIGATDRMSHRSLEIAGGLVINAAGPWAGKLIGRLAGADAAASMPPLAKNMNIVTRPLLADYGVGIPSRRSADAVIGSESRLFFITPWKGVSAIGTTHFPYTGDPDDYRATEAEISEFLDEINDSYPAARLAPEDVLYVYSGLTPAQPENIRGEVGRSKHAEIIDHGRRHGMDGLLSVIGVKYTTARLVAERVVDVAQRKLGLQVRPHPARRALLPGAVGFRSDRQVPPGKDLLAPYGSRPPASAVAAGDITALIEACARHAAREEMAVELEDFLHRRNDLAATGRLTADLVRVAADAMAQELGWSADQTRSITRRASAGIRYIGGKDAADSPQRTIPAR